MFGWLRKSRRAASRPLAVRLVRARFDAAQTTPDNRRHWANADLLSADAAANPEVRRTLRSGARYEVANNCYAKGIVPTIANDAIGTCPRLQVLSGDSATNRVVGWASTSPNRAVSDVSLCLPKRKPFDFLVERPFLKDGRGEWI